MDLNKVFPTFVGTGKWFLSIFEKDRVIKDKESIITNLNVLFN